MSSNRKLIACVLALIIMLFLMRKDIIEYRKTHNKKLIMWLIAEGCMAIYAILGISWI